MSEEEKQAIELLKESIKVLKENASIFISNKYKIQLKIEAYTTILNLINKQQNEIEELQEDKKALVDNYSKVLSSFISKEKIREKIKEINQKSFEDKCSYSEYHYKKEILEELLEK